MTIHTCSYIYLFSNQTIILHFFNMAKSLENTFISSFIHPFCYLSILLIPSKPLMSFCTALILDLFFFLHFIVSLPYNRAGMINSSCNTNTYSGWRSSINQEPYDTCNFPPIYLPITLGNIYIRFIKNIFQIFELWHLFQLCPIYMDLIFHPSLLIILTYF